MMPRPFPFPFNVGTDICSIDRIFGILKGSNGRRFVRRVLIERERHEGLERCDGPLQRWRLAGRVSNVLEWKRRELGLTVRELNKRRYKLKAQACGLGAYFMGEADGDEAEGGKGKGKGGKGGKKIRFAIREELRRELEREIRAEEEAERKLNLEEGQKEFVDGEEAVLAREYAEMGGEEGEESAVVFGGEETATSSEEARREVVDKKEEETPAQKKQKRLDDADIMIRLLDDHEKELETAAEGLWKAAEFLAGRFAAKEAAIKAHHNRKLTYHSIAIHRPPSSDPLEGSQPPLAVILPESGNWEEGKEAMISISHDGEYAIATCLAFEPRPKYHMEGPRRWQPTGTISETSKLIYNQLEMDDMEPEEEEDEHRWREMEEALEEKDRELAGINDPRRLVKVEQLSDDVTAEDLLELFKGESEKLKVHIAVDADGKRRGYAFVSFANSREATRATRQMGRTLLGGKKTICRWMGGKRARIRGLGVGGKKIFKGEGIGPWVEPKSGEGGETEISVSDVAEKEK